MAKRPRLCVDAIYDELLAASSSDEDDIVQDDSDDGEIDHEELEEHFSDVEVAVELQEPAPDNPVLTIDNDEEENDNVPLGHIYLARGSDGGVIKWRKTSNEPRNVRTRSENLVIRLPGPKGEARTKSTAIDCFNLFINNTVVRIIVTSTNIYINALKERFDRERDARCTNAVEIRAFLGILLLSGTLGSNRKKTKQIWDNTKGSGVESCYLAMSEKRFHFLLRCLRFDDVTDRQQRKELDRLAPIRELFEHMVQSFKSFFTPSEYCTLDEQLVAFRGKCPFRMYIPKKPARYGIKVYALVCAKSMYTMNLEVYAGSQPNGPYKISNSSEDVTLRMVEPISQTNRNVTTDNWFTSIPLSEKLLNDHKLTIVGTIKSTRIGVPPELKPNPNRIIKSSYFAFHKKKTLVSYCPKRNKAVVLLSTMHHDEAIDEDSGTDKKPEIVTMYNKTKIGVDVVDQMCAKYNVARNTRRWPMVIFFDLLNVSAINAYCIFKYNSPNLPEKVLRREFLQSIAWELIKPQIIERLKIPGLPVQLKTRGKTLLGIQEDEPQQLRHPQDNRVGRCYMCPRVRDKKSRKNCEKCGRKVCNEHATLVCTSCF